MNAYSGWTKEQILAEDRKLYAAGEYDACHAFQGALDLKSIGLDRVYAVNTDTFRLVRAEHKTKIDAALDAMRAAVGGHVSLLHKAPQELKNAARKAWDEAFA